jgi:hypothetical protein
VSFTPKVPLGIDTVNDTIYIAGTVLIDAGGTALGDLPALSTSYWLVSERGRGAARHDGDLRPGDDHLQRVQRRRHDGPCRVLGPLQDLPQHGRNDVHAGVHVVEREREQQDVHTAAGKVAIKCELYLAGGTTTKIDETIVPIVDAGSNAITVVMSNPSQTVPADNSGTVSSYTNTGTTIQVYEGATLLTFTTGTIGNSKFTCGTPTLKAPRARSRSEREVGQRHDDADGRGPLGDGQRHGQRADHVPADDPEGRWQSVSWSPKQVITKSKSGSTGTRGSFTGNGFQYGIRTSAWSDTLAQRVIENMNTGGTSTSGIATGSMTAPGMVLGDEVTLGNGNPWWTTAGAYSSGTTYDQNDIVISSSVAYRSRQPAT